MVRTNNAKRESPFLKKALSLLSLVLLLTGLVGCGTEAVRMDGKEWKLTVLQSGADGSVIGCGPAYEELYKEIENLTVAELVCSAKDGNFTITNQTDNTSYHGNYRMESTDGNSTVYSITTALHRGTAVSSMTTYESASASVKEVPTLIITVGDYVLCFQAS